MALDEFFDQYISRPVARALAGWFFQRGLSADQVTFVAAALGVGAGISLAGTGLWPILGGLLLVGMVVFDCTDGEVARLQGGSDRPWKGRMLDGYSDAITITAVHIGMIVHLNRVGLAFGGYQLSTFEIFLIALAGGASLFWCSSIVDDVKQRLKPNSIDYQLDRYKDQPKTRFERFLYASAVRYVKNNQKLVGQGRPGGYEMFRQVQWVGPTHHLVGIACAGILTPFFPTSYLTYLAISIVPGCLFLWGVLLRQRRAATRRAA